MTEQAKQVPVYVAEKEATLLKGVFKDNEYLLKVIRSLFFGFDVSETDKTLVKTTFNSAELRTALRKKIFPMLEDTLDMPSGLYADFWLDMERDILGSSENMIQQRILSKKLVFDMLTGAMTLLENPDGQRIDLSYNPKLILNDPLQINLLARSLYIRTVGNGLGLIKMIADQVEKSPEEIKTQRIKDSTK